MSRPRIRWPVWATQLPLVSVVLATLWLIGALVVGIGFRGDLARAGLELGAAARFAIQHPEVRIDPRLLPVARELMPGFESNEMFSFLRNKRNRVTGSQEQFEDMAAVGLAILDAHPTRVLGLVPARPRSYAFLSHVLLHAGVLHGLLTVLAFLLVAPLLERLWGWQVFLPSLAVMALVGAGVFVLAHPDADRALLGGGAIVAGLSAAALVRLRGETIDVLEWLAPIAEVELAVPAWTLAGVWGLYELLAWWSVPVGIPGVDHAVGFAAHAGGATAGALVALGVQRLGWEAKPPAVGPRPAREPDRFDMARVEALRKQGDEQGAFAMLEAAVRRSARNRDAVTLYFELAVARGEPGRAAPALAQLVREELRRGADQVAAACWRDLKEQVPDAKLDAASLVRLAGSLQSSGEAKLAIVALEEALIEDAALSTPLAVRAARIAASLEPELAAEAARRALAGELEPDLRAELEALAGPEPSTGVPGESGSRSGAAELPPNVFYEESDRSAFGAVDDLAVVADFPAGALTLCVPRVLEDEAVLLETEEGGELRLDYGRVRALAVAGVNGLGPKPVLLIDLLVDGSGSERPLAVYRMRSDRFDPRRLASAAPSAIDALRSVVAQLLAGSEALPLPDPKAVVLRPPRMFASVEAYEEQVLQVAERDLA